MSTIYQTQSNFIECLYKLSKFPVQGIPTMIPQQAIECSTNEVNNNATPTCPFLLSSAYLNFGTHR